MSRTASEHYEKQSVSMKALPKQLHPYYNLESIRDPEITNEEKIHLLKVYGKASKEWTPPKSAVAREFALDMILS